MVAAPSALPSTVPQSTASSTLLRIAVPAFTAVAIITSGIWLHRRETVLRVAETERILQLARAIPGASNRTTIPPITPADFIALASNPDAPALIREHLTPLAAPELVAAAAMALGSSKSAEAEPLLLSLAARRDRPPESVEALFRHYQTRGLQQPPPVTIPAQLLEYARHPQARGRAAFAHLGRLIKDPALLPVLETFGSDPEPEVRRASAQALAERRAPDTRTVTERARCIALLISQLRDPDADVATASVRGLASYDDPQTLPHLLAAAKHADFNVRTAAVEALGSRRPPETVSLLVQIVRHDPSAAVRVAAVNQLLTLDAAAAQAVVPELLAARNVYLRAAAPPILARSTDVASATRTLLSLSATDQPRVLRQTALEALGSLPNAKDSSIIRQTFTAALTDTDPGIAGRTATIVARLSWRDLTPQIAAIYSRFPDGMGANARSSAVSAVARIDPADQRTVLERASTDTNPNVRDTALQALATLDQRPAPSPSRGAEITPDRLLPGGAPRFGPAPMLIVVTEHGTLQIRLYPELAPVHCAHIAALARAGFYDGLTWHRIVPDFVAQGGCPRGDGSGNAGVTVPLEPTPLPFVRGTLGMARSNNPDSGGCQLFICHSRALHLDLNYTAYGQVVAGLDVLDRLDLGSKIIRVRVTGVR